MGDTVRRGVTHKVPKEKKPAFFAFTSNLNLKKQEGKSEYITLQFGLKVSWVLPFCCENSFTKLFLQIPLFSLPNRHGTQIILL